MISVLHPWQIVVVALAGWINRQQLDVIEYLKEENRVLREHLKGKRIRFTDEQRRRLAAKAKTLGRPHAPNQRQRRARSLRRNGRVLAGRGWDQGTGVREHPQRQLRGDPAKHGQETKDADLQVQSLAARVRNQHIALAIMFPGTGRCIDCCRNE